MRTVWYAVHEAGGEEEEEHNFFFVFTAARFSGLLSILLVDSSPPLEF
jgi:hypothetical protein